MTSITFKMPTEHSNQLKMLASEERVTVSQYVRALINKKLKTQPIKTPRRPGGRYRGQEYREPYQEGSQYCAGEQSSKGLRCVIGRLGCGGNLPLFKPGFKFTASNTDAAWRYSDFSRCFASLTHAEIGGLSNANDFNDLGQRHDSITKRIHGGGSQ